MSIPFERLKTALADRYAIEIELGRGGMAVVYLAEDLKHHRPVAVKVLNPELAAQVGAERFLREIEIAARLNHPNILALHDSGEADGFLFYVMPFVEGESLRDRLARKGTLPLDDAVRITREVAAALDHAHRQGIVHRDIKPANILLHEGVAMVADFGIARAVSAAGGTQLTQTGKAIGTPRYMSPEQAYGSEDLDARTDTYSLGCVLYETLVGEPPPMFFDAASVVQGHLTDTPPAHRRRLDSVPDHVEQALARSLAKNPADRFGSIAEFSAAVDAARVVRGPATKARAKRILATIAVTGVVLVLAAAALVWSRRPGDGHIERDPNVVAVFPFRIRGADPALGYLREGIIDLLATKLTGEGSPRSADARTVISAWRRAVSSDDEDLTEDASLQVAEALGVGQLLLGELVGTADQLIITASLRSVPDGKVRARASVEGPLDSLSSAIDQLTAQLLARGAGEDETRLEELTTTQLPALKAYLEGQAASRGGAYEEALRHFGLALQLDSTFALAALGFELAASWVGSAVPQQSWALALAWNARQRLSKRDRMFLMVRAGLRYPAPSSAVELLAAIESALEATPYRRELWYALGDIYFHNGWLLGFDDAHQRAAAAFRRAVELDPTWASPLQHLVQIMARAGDTAAVRRLVAMYRAGDTSGPTAEYLRWRGPRVGQQRATAGGSDAARFDAHNHSPLG